ncbi:MAG: tetratricopeptide repeat protein, partial [Saprospiraceae bacterium]
EGLAKLTTSRRLDYYYASLDETYADLDANVNELSLIEEAIEAIDAEQFTVALEILDNSLTAFPNSAIAYDLRGVALLKLNRLADAETNFTQAIELRPDFAIAWYNLGRIAEQLGKSEAAMEHFNQALELEGDLTKAYFDRALLHKKTGDAEAAIADYDKILELRGDSYLKAYINRGLARKTLGDYVGALADLNKAIEEFPRQATLRNHRGNLHLLFGYHNRALEDYTRAIQLDNDYAEAYYNRGLTHFVVYDQVSGCADLEKSSQLGYERAAEKQRYFCVQ